MSISTQSALNAAILRLLRPLVRILLRNGVSYGAFAELAKWVYVDVASDEFAIPGRKQTTSRVSVITGLTRKEVARLQAEATRDDEALGEKYNRAARVLSGWMRDPRFGAGNGLLPLDGDEASFTSLVREYSGDMPSRAVLDELLRVGAVEMVEGEGVRLLSRGYVPQTGESEKLHILGTDVNYLISTIDHNLRHGSRDPLFQRKVAYDNLPEEAIPELRALSREKAQLLLEDLDAWMSLRDRDSNPSAGGSGRKRAGVAIYYFEDDVQEERRS